MSEQEWTARSSGAVQCAPVLAGIKPANTLRVGRQIGRRTIERILAGTGLACELLCRGRWRNTWLVYRQEELAELLRDPQRRAFLQKYGYIDFSMSAVLARLAHRLAAHQRGAEYPHEVGILLGYPLEDVLGFVENKGKDPLCTGYWKVYGDVARAERTFALFHRARRRAARAVEQGMSFRELAEILRDRWTAEAV